MTRQKWGMAPAVMAVLVLAACSSDREEFEQVVVPIEGAWIMNASLEQDQGDMQCDVENVRMNVVQQPGARRLFGGNANGGILTCVLAGETASRPFESLQITTGVQSQGINIAFNLNPAESEGTFLDFEGNLDQLFWSGNVQGLMEVDLLGEGLAAFTGTWTAERTN